MLYVGEPKNPLVWAARATPATLGDSSGWEWFCGRDGGGAPIWSRATVHQRVFATGTARGVVPVFRDPRGAGKHVMISHCPSLSGYVLAKTQNPMLRTYVYHRLARLQMQPTNVDQAAATLRKSLDENLAIDAKHRADLEKMRSAWQQRRATAAPTSN